MEEALQYSRVAPSTYEAEGESDALRELAHRTCLVMEPGTQDARTGQGLLDHMLRAFFEGGEVKMGAAKQYKLVKSRRRVIALTTAGEEIEDAFLAGKVEQINNYQQP